MTIHNDLLSYNRIAVFFDGANALFSPSESHGIICGLICAGIEATGISYLDLILGTDNQDNLDDWQQSRHALLQLYEYSSEKLRDMAFDFSLLLPDDDNLLKERAQALSEWCSGFVTGLSLSGINIQQGGSEETRDALFHFSEIAKIDYKTIDMGEEDEKAYVEVMEYTRMAVLMIYAEFASNQGTGKKITVNSNNDHLH